MTLDQQLDELIQNLPRIASEKRYWLIRTQSGELYDTFRENGFIAIGHTELPLSTLYNIRQESGEDLQLAQRLIRDQIKEYYEPADIEVEDSESTLFDTPK